MPPPDVQKPAGSPTIATNRKARFHYQIVETVETGIELLGTEVKSLRSGHASLDESFARVENGAVVLHALHIKPYEYAGPHNHEPRRPRRLLLHRREIHRLFGQAAVKGQALIPLRLYWKHNRVKVELALARGKLQRDKRETLRRQTADREAERAMAARKRR